MSLLLNARSQTPPGLSHFLFGKSETLAAHLRFGLRFRPGGLPRRMPAGELDFCDGKFALTLYMPLRLRISEIGQGLKRMRRTLLQLNSRLESLIGISLFLRRKSKILRSISLFPCRKSQIPCSISLSPQRKCQNSAHFAFSAQKMPNSAERC